LSISPSKAFSLNDLDLTNIHNLRSQNWDIFTVPIILIEQLQNQEILLGTDNQFNIILTLSYGNDDRVEFENAIEAKNRTQFFKLSEKNGVNHTLYRIVNHKLEFIKDIQIAIPGYLTRFTGCYLENSYNGEILALTTNAYPESILNKMEIGILDTIPHQEIVLSKFNKETDLFEDIYTAAGVAKLEDTNGYYHYKNYELRDPCVYLYKDNYVEFVFCARDKRGRAAIGRGFCDLADSTLPIIETLSELELDGNYLYLECPQIFIDKDDNQWLLASVGDIMGNHYQGCWVLKNEHWARANGNGRLDTNLPKGYETYSGKLQIIDGQVYYTCWIANPEGTPSCIMAPTLVSLDYNSGSCSLDKSNMETVRFGVIENENSSDLN
jgi:hypothetical protein